MLTKAPSLKTQSGFTLIELLITMTVLGVLMAIAIPNLRDFMVSNRLSSNVNGFIGLMNYARSEAIVRNREVIVCPKNNGSNACVVTDSWENFEIQVFAKGAHPTTFVRNFAPTFELYDEPLKTIAAVDTSSAQFKFAKQAGPNVIAFQSGGLGTNTYRFDINVISSDTAYEIKYGRTICISRPGRTRVLGLSNACPA